MNFPVADSPACWRSVLERMVPGPGVRVAPIGVQPAKGGQTGATRGNSKHVHKDFLDMVNCYLMTFRSALGEVADSSTDCFSYD